MSIINSHIHRIRLLPMNLISRRTTIPILVCEQTLSLNLAGGGNAPSSHVLFCVNESALRRFSLKSLWACLDKWSIKLRLYS